MLANLSDFLADPLEAPDFLQKKKFDKNFPGAVLASLTRLWTPAAKLRFSLQPKTKQGCPIWGGMEVTPSHIKG